MKFWYFQQIWSIGSSPDPGCTIDRIRIRNHALQQGSRATGFQFFNQFHQQSWQPFWKIVSKHTPCILHQVFVCPITFSVIHFVRQYGRPYVMYACKSSVIMVLLLEGKGAHVMGNLCYLTFLKHSIGSRAVINQIIFSIKKNFPYCLRNMFWVTI